MMKSVLKYVILFFCAFPFSVSAQNHYEANIAFGAKAGCSMSKTMFNPSVPQGFQPGILVGGAFRYIEEKNFGVIVELNIEQRGWKEKYEQLPYNYSRAFTYIQMPMLTHIYFGGNKFKGFFNAGPEIGYMISHKTSSNFDYNNIENIEDFPTANRHNEQLTLDIKNRFDYGISAGLGAEYRFSPKQSINFEGRVYYGLNNVFSSHKTDVFSGSNALSLMLTIGYYYRVK